MKDFASFQGGGKLPEDTAREIGEIAARYDSEGEDALLKDICLRAAEGKRNGTLTNEQIDEFCRRFAPSLDEKRRKKLFSLAERLKKI